MDTKTRMAFQGKQEEQELAAHVFEIARRQGVLFGANTPIKLNVAKVAQTLTKEGGAMAGGNANELVPRIESALKSNPAVFAPAGSGEYITTKAGHAPQTGKTGTAHTFRERLNTEAVALGAEESRNYESELMNKAASRAERNALMETIIDVPAAPMPIRTPQPPVTPTIGIPTLIPQHLVPQPPAPEKVEEPEAPAVPATPVPVAPAMLVTSQRTQEQAPVTPAASVAPPVQAPTTPARHVEDEEARRPAVQQPAAPAQARPAVESQPQRPPVEEAPVRPAATAPATPVAPATPAPAAETPVVTPPRPQVTRPATPSTPAPPVYTGPVEVRVMTPDGPLTLDLRQPVDQILANEQVANAIRSMVGAAVENDSRLVSFGTDIFPEEALDRFSKGDFRRIKEYLDEPETGGVASDRDIMADVLNRRPDQPDYERLRFSLDFRLLKEKKDFEFVGINSDRLWINAGVSPVPAPPTRKPAEIGQDYRFLEDPAIASVEAEDSDKAQAPGPLTYALTYYEYENGVLPYDWRAKRLFKGPLFEDQRSSLLRFEIPQLYGALVVELRYPTGNRGGFIMGLNDFFSGHLVPGALFTVMPTDRGEDIFEIHFTVADEQEENLLQIDERRGRYVFRPVTYSVETDPSMFLSQEKFGKMQNQKKLEESERRRPDVIITNAFQVVGDDNDGKLWAIIDDIYPLVNIERPISRSWLRTLLSGAYPFFYPDETTAGAYFYDPSKRPA